MILSILAIVAGLPLIIAALFAGLAQGKKSFCVPEFGKNTGFEGADFPKMQKKVS